MKLLYFYIKPNLYSKKEAELTQKSIFYNIADISKQELLI